MIVSVANSGKEVNHEKFEPFQEEATDLCDQTGIKL